jgi:hypothetical protein
MNPYMDSKFSSINIFYESFIKLILFLLEIAYIVNALERRFGLDLNGDGYIGGPGKYIYIF